MAGLPKLSEQHVKNFISKKNGTLLSKYINSKAKIKIKCNVCQNVWSPRFTDIKHSGCWCPPCAYSAISDKRRTNIDDVSKEIFSKNGNLISHEGYRNARSKIKIKCNLCSNVWDTTMTNIRGGHWCPYCKHKTQRKLFDIIKEIFPKYECDFNYKGFDWLATKTGRRQEIDIFVKSNDGKFSLGIEYDGIQHFEPVKLFGGEEEFKRTKKRDAIKNRKIKKHTNDVKFFIRFNYKKKIYKKNVIKK